MVISSVDGHINYLPFCTFGMQIVAEHMFPLAKKGPGQPFASPPQPAANAFAFNYAPD